MEEVDYRIPEKEKFNTGVGYYGRVNQLLNEEVKAILEGNKPQRYHILWCLYLDLLPKCSDKEKKIMKDSFIEITKKLNEVGCDANELPDNMMTEWSSYMRELLDAKGMLTPKGEDPNRALSGGSF